MRLANAANQVTLAGLFPKHLKLCNAAVNSTLVFGVLCSFKVSNPNIKLADVPFQVAFVGIVGGWGYRQLGHQVTFLASHAQNFIGGCGRLFGHHGSRHAGLRLPATRHNQHQQSYCVSHAVQDTRPAWGLAS